MANRKRRLERKVLVSVNSIINNNELFSVSGDAGLADILGVYRQTIATWRKQNVIPKECYSQRVDRNTGEPKGHISYNVERVLIVLKNRIEKEYYITQP